MMLIMVMMMITDDDDDDKIKKINGINLFWISEAVFNRLAYFARITFAFC